MAAFPLVLPAAAGAAVAGAAGAAAVGLALVEGDAVLVREDFSSDSDEPAALKRGQTGLVVYVDSDGDAYISFQAHRSKQWVYAENFRFLALIRQRGGAVEQREAAEPSSTSASAAPAAAREGPPSEGRSVLTSPSLAAAPQETTRRWRYAPRELRPLAIRALPDVEGPRTGDLLRPGDVFEVAEERQGAGGVRLLKLADGRGWAFAGKAGVGSLCEPFDEAAAPPVSTDLGTDTEPPPLIEGHRLAGLGSTSRSPVSSSDAPIPAAIEPAALADAPALLTRLVSASGQEPLAAGRRTAQDSAEVKAAPPKAADVEPTVLTFEQAKELLTSLQCACVEPAFEERLQGCLVWARSRPRGKRDAAMELRVGELLLEILRPSLARFALGRGRRGLQAFFDAIRQHQEDPEIYEMASDVEMVLHARPGGWFGMNPFREGSLLYVKGPACVSEPHLEGAACVLEAWEPRRKRWRVRLVGEDATRLIGEEHLAPGPSPLEREEALEEK